jgi:hypothetical protein
MRVIHITANVRNAVKPITNIIVTGRKYRNTKCSLKDQTQDAATESQRLNNGHALVQDDDFVCIISLLH